MKFSPKNNVSAIQLSIRLILNSSLCLGTLSILNLATVQAAHSFAVRTGFDSNVLPRNDDDSTGAVNIGFTVNFFGVNRSSLFVNNNGNVTFDAPLGEFTPFGLTNTSREIIAPFFADVDTLNPASDVVTYGSGLVDGRNAFGVNWGRRADLDGTANGVGYFEEAADKTNQFQLVLIDRSDTGTSNIDFEFNYDQIQWETGDASDGRNGLGGSSARAGFSKGTGKSNISFELNGSAVNGAFLDTQDTGLINNRLNSDVDGRYVFASRGGKIEDPKDPIAAVPEPSSFIATLVAGAFGIAMKRKRQLAKKAKL